MGVQVVQEVAPVDVVEVVKILVLILVQENVIYSVKIQNRIH